MDWLEKFQQKFGGWYQGVFGASAEPELTPRDVLRKIIDAMEYGQSEGLDGKIYVPNKYILELAVDNRDERDYLLSFLDEQELISVLDRYMAHKNYLTRGPLDFTIEEVDPLSTGDKLYVRTRYEKPAGSAPDHAAAPISATSRLHADSGDDDLLTVVASKSSSSYDDDLTVAAIPAAWAALMVTDSDGKTSVVSLNKSVFTVGRSRHSDNDLVLSSDGQVSKRHVRIERERDGGATLYDLASTNGTTVNGVMVLSNVALKAGDVIEIGRTKLEFQRDDAHALPDEGPNALNRQPMPVPSPGAPAIMPLETRVGSGSPGNSAGQASSSPRLLDPASGREFAIGSEVLIGRGLTCDVVLDIEGIATRQARILRIDDGSYTIEDLSGRASTLLNGRPLRLGERAAIHPGDELVLNRLALLFRQS